MFLIRRVIETLTTLGHLTFALVLLLLLSDAQDLNAREASFWTTPQPGWLYVLDVANDHSRPQVLLIDPETGVRRGSILLDKRGSDAQMALSPDGRQLYLFELGTLNILDTSTGKSLAPPEMPIAFQYQYQYQYPTFASIAISNNGNWLYTTVTRSSRNSSLDRRYGIRTYDVMRGIFLPDNIPLSECAAPLLQPRERDLQLYVLCPESDTIHKIRIASDGSMQKESNLNLQTSRLDRLETAAGRLKTGGWIQGNGLVLLTGDGRILIDEDRADMMTAKPAGHIPNGVWARPGPIVSSPDGTQLFVGVSEKQGGHPPDALMVLDTVSFKSLGTVVTPEPFLDLAISKDGRHLYAAAVSSSTLMIIDTTSSHRVRSVSGVGTRPVQILPAP